MVKWLLSKFQKKKSYISPADEAYMKGKLKAVENPMYAIEGAEPFDTYIGTVRLPKFTKELARISGSDLETYLERFLVHCLYMEQGLQINSGNTGFRRLTPDKPEFFSHSPGPKNPKIC